MKIAILGTSYCGSTIVSRLLNALPDTASLGELHWLVDGRAQKHNTYADCRPCADLHLDCPLHLADVDELVRAGLLERKEVYDEIQYRTGAANLITSDKLPRIVTSLSLPGTVHGLVLWKRPEAMLASYKRHRDCNMEIFVRVYNEILTWAPTHLISIRSLFYEDVVTDPVRALSRIAHTFGIEPPKKDIDFDDLESIPYHMVGGNIVAHLSQRLVRDDRWMTKLTNTEKRRACSEPGLDDLLDRLRSIQIP